MPKKSKNYFTQETEDAIILYNNTESPYQRSKIYENLIHYPFFKLTQNIIHTFKFYHTDVEELEDLQHEIIVFLLSKIHLYNHINNIQKRINKIITKEFKCEYEGDFPKYANYADKVTQEQINAFIDSLTISNNPDISSEENEAITKECKLRLYKITPPKAYSYFGTIVKRWLIIYNEKNYKNKIQNSQIEDLIHNPDYSYYLDDTSRIEDLSDYIESFIGYVTENIYEIFPKCDDAKIADAVLELFRKRENIELFNRKELYIYIREILPNVKTPKITKISNRLREIFEKNHIFYLENGYVSFQELE
jgi:hypothetical protein